MGTFVPPAGSGSVAPPSPTSGVVIGSSDQLSLDYIIGKTIIAGSQFSDTLGRFFPVVLTNLGITINSEVATGAVAITFHNTTSAGTDELIGLGTSNALVFSPNSATSVNNPVVINDRTGATYLGIILYPALVSGGVAQPEIDVSSPAGTGNAVYRFGANFLQFVGTASGSAPTIFALGADTDVFLYLAPKGAGTVGFQYASTALGGGAAPTLGTIGGSGPATAGQNSWLKVVVNGANRWIPLWA